LYNLPALHTWDPTSALIKPNVGIYKLIFDRLIERDAEGNLRPSLATEWKKLSDTEWELKLRDGVKFHDGSSFEAEDVKASLERYTDPTRKSPYAGLYAAKQFKVGIKEPLTVTVDTQQPMAVFLKYLSLVSIVSSEAVAKEAWDTPMGTGPFKFVSLDGERLTLDANLDYWDRPPGYKTLIWDYVPDADARISALRSGGADVIIGIPPDKDTVLNGDPNVKLYRVPSDELRLLFVRGPKFADPRVRQAVMYAIDRKAILDGIELGKGKLASAHVSTPLLGWADMNTATGTTYNFDPNKAKQLLQAANFPFNEPLKYVTTAYFPRQVEVSQAITQFLQDVGMNVQLKVGEAGQWFDAHSDESVELLDTGWPTHFWDPDEILYMVTPAMWDWSSKFRDKSLAELVAKQDTIVESNERAAFISGTLLPKLWELMPWIPLYDRTVSWATSAKLQGFVPWPSEMETRFLYDIALQP
jgi:peptide/nickel transport system substrate-binding protein